MSLRYLLDTNVLAEPLKPRPNTKVLNRLRNLGAEISISSVVWHELLYGMRRLPAGTRRSNLERYLVEVIAPTIPILPYDERAAAWHASERARLDAAGSPPPFADGQIAAIASVNDLVLVTNNTRDFAWFQDVKIENWSK